MLPFFQLRPWVTANRLQSALDKLGEAYGERPYFLTLSEPEAPVGRREVHDELDLLRSPRNGFGEWCQFVEDRGNIVPSLQLTDVGEFDLQTERLHALGRGVIVHIERAAFPFIKAIAARTAAGTSQGENVFFVLDFGRQSKTFLLQQVEVMGYVTEILRLAPHARIAISASSFPDTFTSIKSQSIYERELFEALKKRLGRALIYSDRGSARAERQTGGGGVPAPRIDYAGGDEWHFFRADGEGRRAAAYEGQAQKLIDDKEVWDENLRVWGTQMIERTALGDEGAIVSAARATAARINIHLHRQTFYDDPDGLYDTDEEWTD